MINIKGFQCGPMGANCYVVSDSKGVGFMVDPGGANGKMETYIEENKIKIEYIILTHGHGDHIGGVPHYKTKFPEAKLVAYKDEADMLKDSKVNFSRMTYGQDVSCEADIYVDDEETLTVGENELRFIFTPGHTPGGMCIYTQGHLFSGDTLFAQSIGRTDFPGGSMTKILKSIRERLYALPNETKVYPGHMGLTTIQTEKEYNPFA